MKNVTQRVAWAGITLFALVTFLIVSRYLTFNPDVYFPAQRETYIAQPVGLFCHIIGSMTAMLIGPFQFLPSLRRRWTNLHRGMGRVYLSGCLIGGSAGLYMAFFAHGGFPARVGFGMLAVLWLTTGAMALARIRVRRIAEHREWMIRSFALTFAAATLRIYLTIHGILLGTQLITLSETEMYTAVAWLCWVPNLIFAEIYVNLSRPKRESLIVACTT